MARSGKDLLADAKARIREVESAYVKGLLDRKAGAALLDVREPDETAQGTIPGALLLPRGHLEMRVEKLLPDRAREVVVYCAGGNRSAFAARTLMELGYADVKSMAGGYGAWAQAGLPVETPVTLNPDQMKRYSRHLLIPEVGLEGQAKLLKSRVALVGAGGLGSPAAFYLAAAGVGHLDLIDFDVVDESNLQRQILHKARSVGRPKAESGRETLLELNPALDVRAVQERVEPVNVERLLKDCDLVVDGCDNFSTRYLVNDGAWRLGKPNVFGSVYRFEGQVTVFAPGKGPCYRCLFPSPPPPEFAPSCDEAGVLGVLPGVVGLLQATEAVKVLLGRGEPLVGRLLAFDALAMRFREFKVARDPACILCGEKPTWKGYEEIAQACASNRS